MDPLILLVGGAPGVGKTTLGRALAARRRAASFTVDDMLVAASVLTTPESHPAFHQMRSAGGHLRYFIETPPERLISDALEQEEAVWPIVEALVAAHARRRSAVVIDWWLLRPSVIAAMHGVASIWIRLDPDALWERERLNHEFTDGSSDPEEMLDHFMARSLWRNQLMADDAAACGLPLLRLAGDETPDTVADMAEAALAQARVS